VICRLLRSQWNTARTDANLEINTIHKFTLSDSGPTAPTDSWGFYKFIGFDASIVSASVCEFRYTWSFDRGIPVTAAVANTADTAYPPPTHSFAGETWIAAPHHNLALAITGDGNISNLTAWKWENRTMYSYVPNGWESLIYVADI
jgi:hypothetical protein